MSLAWRGTVRQQKKPRSGLPHVGRVGARHVVDARPLARAKGSPSGPRTTAFTHSMSRTDR